MTADAGDGPASGDGPDATWLRRLYELEHEERSPDTRSRATASEDDAPPTRSPRSPARRARAAARPPSGDSRSTILAGIREASRFDALALDGQPADHHFGREVPATVRAGRDSAAVSLCLFQEPDAEEAGFPEVLADQLERWRSVADVRGVRPLLDTADDPRAWALTARAPATLADRGRSSLSALLREARTLVHALATLHDRGVVHAGIQPESVVYASPDAPSPEPLLDAPGLLDVYRRYTDPAGLLDPRYAAPEYFTDDRGIVDRATDLYQLGTVLFRLFTGQAPYDGSPAAVREAVLDEPMPAPSSVEPALPEGLDVVVQRAAATRKHDRYETADALAADLDAICRDLR
jgi:hypothetical protein